MHKQLQAIIKMLSLINQNNEEHTQPKVPCSLCYLPFEADWTKVP